MWNVFSLNSLKNLSLFHDKIKTNFEKEQYLDYVANSATTYATTKIRINAHDLEIEAGRYKKIPRDKRICKWYKLTLGLEKLETSDATSITSYVENENHVLMSYSNANYTQNYVESF